MGRDVEPEPIDEHVAPPGNSTASEVDVKLPYNLYRKAGLFVVVVVVGGLALTVFRDVLTLDNLVKQEAALQRFRLEHPVFVYVAAFAVYVLVTGLSLPGAALMTLVLGSFFKFWRALILVSFASTAGATLAFLLSRYLLRETIERRFGARLARFAAALEREGAFYLFTLRLIPQVPFFAINVVMGLTPMRVGTYWWVSQVGMLAGTCVYVNAGAALSFEQLQRSGIRGILTPQLIAAFLLLGLFPIAVKKIMARFRPVTTNSND